MNSQYKPVESVRTFFSTLFDFSFSKFITVQMFPALYGIILISSLVGVLFYTFEAFMASFWKGLFYLFIAGPIAFMAIASITRAIMEFYIVVFRMAQNIDEMRMISGKLSGITDTMDGMRDLTRKLPFWNLVGKGGGSSSGGEDRKDKPKVDPVERDIRAKRQKDVNWPY